MAGAKKLPSLAPTAQQLSKNGAAHADAGATFKSDDSVVQKVKSVADAEVTLQRLKQRKRELAVEKKAMNTRLAQLRAGHRIKLGRRGSMMRGGGGIGSFVRALEQGARDADRAQYANLLLPLEQAKAKIDAQLLNVESAIAQVHRCRGTSLRTRCGGGAASRGSPSQSPPSVEEARQRFRDRLWDAGPWANLDTCGPTSPRLRKGGLWDGVEPGMVRR